jgi:DNA (cytosine-5)-methyltransferase 1
MMMRAIELFAGAGGLGMGISRAGFAPVRIVEWNRWCCETIRANRSSGHDAVSDWPEPLEGDIRPLNFADLEGKIELVSGGPPCQPFSLGGKHRANHDNRDMWSEAVRVVRETRPKAFIFENVKGLTRASFATYLAYIVHQLSHPEIEQRSDECWTEHLARLERHQTASGGGLRYNVIWQVLNAADYGVPQRRERVVFVGFRSDLGISWSFPEGTHSIDALLWEQTRDWSYWDRHRVPMMQRKLDDRLEIKGLRLAKKSEKKPWRTVRDALAGLPEPQEWSSEEFGNHKLQTGARSYPGHTGSPLDEPAKTLKAGVHGVPGGENMLLRPDGSVRYFSVRESARLQTFPDNYVFSGSWTESMRQIGNAVPVEFAHAIAEDVRKHLKRSA